MHRTAISLLFALLATLGTMRAPAQSRTAGPLARLQAYVANVNTFNRLFPQEKTYVQLNNTGYFVGERLWYKAYVVRTDRGQLTNLSHVLYVELVDPFGEVVVTQKRPLSGGTADGCISLDKLSTSGFYELRAYTRYATNFDARATFSRVIPVFERPKTEGDYSQRLIRSDMAAMRRTDSATVGDRRRPVVKFYPEGGHLVSGLMSRVAFDVSLPDSVGLDVEAQVRDAAGNAVATAKTERDGRGVFACLADGTAPLVFSFTHGGRRYDFPLPAAAETGCVVTVNALTARAVGIEVNASPQLRGTTLGLTLMRNGTVEYFDTIRVSAEPWGISLERDSLAAGVHQLTLFGPDGRIYAERQFFVAPRRATDVVRVRAAFADSAIAPRAPMRLRLGAPAGTAFALSVTDAATATNGGGISAAAWWLLAGELRGYVRDADYYLGTDDDAHRRAADLLCLVQGWTRYDWRTMSGNAPFAKRQPIEDSLYIDGRIYPRLDFKGSAWMTPKARRRTKDVAGVDIALTLYNETGNVWRGRAVTDTAGSYAFVLPELTGNWTAVLSTKKGGEDKPQIIAINRRFSPALRPLDYYETELTPAAPARFAFGNANIGCTPAPSIANDRRDVQLGEAVVKGQRRLWTVLRGHIAERSQIHYDMEREIDSYTDRGEDVPLLKDWFLSKPALAHEFIDKKRAVGFVYRDNRRASYWINGDPERVYITSSTEAELPGVGSQTIRLHVTYGEDLDGRSADDSINTVEAVKRSREQWRTGGAPNLYIDELLDVFVSMENFGTRYMYPYERSYLLRHNPFHVFYFERHPPLRRSPSARNTSFSGYNVCETFDATDASRQPAATDHRRTLYWNPNVTVGAGGTAEVSFLNNTTARSLQVTIGGITPTAVPVVGE